MNAALFTGLILLPLLGLVCLLWWRFGGSGKGKEIVLVAASNHRSLKRFHYGPGPAPPAMESAAAPPPKTRNPLSQLLPEEDFRAQAEKKPPSAAGTEASPQELAEPATKSPPTVAEKELAAVPQPTSPRPASNATVSVLDVLAVDAPAAPTAAKWPAAVAEATPPSSAAAEDESVAESLFDNPLTAATPTKNDEANRLTAAALRRRNRAALQAASARQLAALTNLLAENNPPR